MKLKCITKNSNRFTDGKVYDAEIFSENTIRIVTDDGSEWEYSIALSHHLFIPLEQWREQQLNKIINE